MNVLAWAIDVPPHTCETVVVDHVKTYAHSMTYEGLFLILVLAFGVVLGMIAGDR